MARRLAVIAIIAVSAPAAASDRFVCASGCSYATIGAAVGAANAGDRVLVRPGDYAEDLTITKAITLWGLGGSAATTLRGQTSSFAVTVPANVSATVRGFAITPHAGGVHVDAGATATLIDLAATGAWADAVVDSTDASVFIDGLNVTGWAGPVALRAHGGALVVTHATLDEVTVTDAIVRVDGGARLNLSHATVAGAHGGTACLFDAGTGAAVTVSTARLDACDGAPIGLLGDGADSLGVGDSAFSDATGGGFVVGEIDGAVTIARSAFVRTSTTADGGAASIAHAHGTVSIVDSRFASTHADGDGGAVFIDAAEGGTTVTGTRFVETSAARGGALFTRDNIDISAVGTARATAASAGGALSATGTTKLDHSVICGTSGATALSLGDATLTDDVFDRNAASGPYAIDFAGSTARLTDTFLLANGGSVAQIGVSAGAFFRNDAFVSGTAPQSGFAATAAIVDADADLHPTSPVDPWGGTAVEGAASMFVDDPRVPLSTEPCEHRVYTPQNGSQLFGAGADDGTYDADIGPFARTTPGPLDDRDGDGFAPPWDCDDADKAVHPGAVEACNDQDDDCDARVDDLDETAPTGAITWHPDLDGDGHGAIGTTGTRQACVDADLGPAWATLADDCDDADALAFPGAAEIPYDGVDEDCDGAEACDLDGDGADAAKGACGGDDCDDTNAAIGPDVDEVVYDNVDNDCDPATLDDDLDQDGHKRVADCDESDPTIYDGAEDHVGDGIDENCDGVDGDKCDLDEDGHRLATCGGNDCDDADPTVHGGAAEVDNDGVDQDCDGADETKTTSGAGLVCGCASADGRGASGLLALSLALAASRRRR